MTRAYCDESALAHALAHVTGADHYLPGCKGVVIKAHPDHFSETPLFEPDYFPEPGQMLRFLLAGLVVSHSDSDLHLARLIASESDIKGAMAEIRPVIEDGVAEFMANKALVAGMIERLNATGSILVNVKPRLEVTH